MKPSHPSALGRYRIEGLLGRGGQGEVYRARDPQGRLVALKLLSSRDPRHVRRHAREVAALNALRQQPAVPSLLEAGRLPDGREFLAQELIEGEPLDAWIKHHGLPPPEQAVELIDAVAETLAAAHALGLIHRDVKPQNVLVPASGQPPAVLLDWGLTRRVGTPLAPPEQSVEGELTREGDVVGSPAWLAPEQVDPETHGEQGPAADVYGLGGLLYFLLCGQPPLANARGQAALLFAVLHKPPRPPHAVRPAAHPGLSALALQLLAKQPTERPATVELVRERLHLALKDPGGRPGSRRSRAQKARLAGLAGLAGLLATLVGLAALAAAGAWPWTRSDSGSAPSPAAGSETPEPEPSPGPEAEPPNPEPGLSPSEWRRAAADLSQPPGQALLAARAARIRARAGEPAPKLEAWARARAAATPEHPVSRFAAWLLNPDESPRPPWLLRDCQPLPLPVRPRPLWQALASRLSGAASRGAGDLERRVAQLRLAAGLDPGERWVVRTAARQTVATTVPDHEVLLLWPRYLRLAPAAGFIGVVQHLGQREKTCLAEDTEVRRWFRERLAQDPEDLDLLTLAALDGRLATLARNAIRPQAQAERIGWGSLAAELDRDQDALLSELLLRDPGSSWLLYLKIDCLLEAERTELAEELLELARLAHAGGADYRGVPQDELHELWEATLFASLRRDPRRSWAALSRLVRLPLATKERQMVQELLLLSPHFDTLRERQGARFGTRVARFAQD